MAKQRVVRPVNNLGWNTDFRGQWVCTTYGAEIGAWEVSEVFRNGGPKPVFFVVKGPMPVIFGDKLVHPPLGLMLKYPKRQGYMPA